jgi:hypothetical protein
LLHHGTYNIAAVVDANTSAKPLIIKGPVIDLFDQGLPVLTEKKVPPGEQAFLYNLAYLDKSKRAKVLAAAARVYDEKVSSKGYSFVAKSRSQTANVMRILLPAKPKMVLVTRVDATAITITANNWDAATKTLLLGFENRSEGVNVKIEW